jgi:DNA uptake protein ComE-like DNA-binding protein
MNPVKESIRSWFGFTRRERRSTFILLLIILAVIGLRYIVPEKNMTMEEIRLNFREVATDSTLASAPAGKNYTQERPVSRRVRKTILEINSCDSAALEALPGLGPVLSARIIKYRKLIGGFVTVDQLREVYGLPEETFNLVSSGFTVDTLLVRKININKLQFNELIRHPYFERNEVTAILKFRELKGSIHGINEMVENNLISSETAKKMRGYLEF